MKVNSGKLTLTDVLLHNHDQIVEDPMEPGNYLYDLEVTDFIKNPIIIKNNYNYEEISEKLKCPVGTVRSRLFNAREILSQKYGKIFFDILILISEEAII